MVITYEDSEKLIGIPKLFTSSGRVQVNAIFNALKEWKLENKV